MISVKQRGDTGPRPQAERQSLENRRPGRRRRRLGHRFESSLTPTEMMRFDHLR
jgi:hypothetical protein